MIEDYFHHWRCRIELLLERRRLRDALVGLPALLVVIVAVLMLMHFHNDFGSGRVGSLEKDAQARLDQGQFMEARLLAMRLVRENPKNQKAVVIEAKALRGMGREKEAGNLLARVAPLDLPGYAPAHVLQAAMLLSQPTPDVEAARHHIDNALHSDPNDQDALELAARFAVSRQDWKMALEWLTQMKLAKRADLMLMKATAFQFSGMEQDAIKCAHEAETMLRAMQESVAEDSADRIRLSIAVSLGLQRKFEHAIQWMADTITGELTAEQRQVAGGLYLSWSRYLKQQRGSDKLRVLALVEKALEISPESQDIIMAFLGDCEGLAISEDERKQHLERVLSKGGIAQSFLHHYLGQQEWKKGSKEAARSHFEMASVLNPRFKVISNNLAMAIAAVSTDQEELEKALSMMEELLKQEPGNPFFLDTRGHVLIKLGRYQEAVRDLSQALPNARDKKSANATLAGLYLQLGMPELAARHQNTSESLAR